MMMRSIVLVLVLVSVQTWSQSVDQTSPGVLDLSRRWADFGVRLYKTAASRSDQNLLLSTGGAALGLTSVQDRSSGTGRDQLDGVLNLEGLQGVPDLVSGLRSALGQTSLGDVVWFQAETEARDQLEKFGTSFRSLGSSVQDSVDSIERWIQDQIRDQVQIQKPGLDLGSDPQLVLASAQYLQARFSVPFNSSSTAAERFFVDRYRTVMVPMMMTSGRFYLAYDRELRLGVLRLGLQGAGPGAGPAAAMLVLFPDEGVSLGSIEDRLSGDQVRTWIRRLQKTRLEVQLPRFTLAQALTLKTVLQKLQVSQVFADNSLSQVLNAAVLVGDETSDVVGGASSFKIPPPRLTVNRPFLLVVYHEATGVLQMIGRVVDPTQK